MTTLIVNPLQEELDYLLQGCIEHGYCGKDALIGRLGAVRLPGLKVTLALGGVGKAQFALQTQHLLDIGEGWDLVVCAGAAGALGDDLSIGDVVIATDTVEHDYNNRFSERPVPRFAGHQATIKCLRRVYAPSDAFKIRFGTIASGDEDVIDTARRKSLHQSTGALAVAWEGAGGARACAFSNVPFVEIRGVTDTADQDAPADFETHLELAMKNIAALIVAWMGDDRE